MIETILKNIKFVSVPTSETFECLKIAQGLCRPLHPKSQASGRWYVESRAILIGIDNYQDQNLPSLSSCVNDATMMNDRLKQLGFKTELLINQNATRHEILKHIFSHKAKPNQNERLIIFFAGHGLQESPCFVPYDYDRNNPSATCIPYNNFGVAKNFQDQIEKHCLLIFDCCHPKVATRESTNPQLINMLNKPVQEILSSCQSDQRATEETGHGIFTRYLLEALSGAVFRPGESYITPSHLFLFLQNRMQHLPNQTPTHYRNGDGSFIIENPVCRESLDSD